jgi:hypothetical protein
MILVPEEFTILKVVAQTLLLLFPVRGAMYERGDQSGIGFTWRILWGAC